ncbi:MAG: hypothetical protein KatS3mg003_0608 [Candidatus Nitrosocaldaceae archaeon]|nr:MAG: hypothetical protein KatS3mg003_0608 [Candidatus Nitrosocaldaceae archaeon]
MNITTLVIIMSIGIGIMSITTANVTHAQTEFTQELIVTPSTVMPGDSITITCLSEPSHPLGVNGIIEVTDPDGNVFSTAPLPFVIGDVNGNLIQDDSLTVIFPTDFPGANTNIAGEYLVFCDFWSGPTVDPDPGEATPLTGAFWQYFWVTFSVLPESAIGAIAIVGAGIAVFAAYTHKKQKTNF